MTHLKLDQSQNKQTLGKGPDGQWQSPKIERKRRGRQNIVFDSFKKKTSCRVLEKGTQVQKSKFLPSPFLVKRAAPVSISLAYGPHSCASTVNATVGGGGATGHLVALCYVYKFHRFFLVFCFVNGFQKAKCFFLISHRKLSMF